MSVHWLIRTGGEIITATSATEACAALIGGYVEASDDEALLARWRLAVDVSCHRQAVLAAEAQQAGRIDVAEMTEEDLTILFADRLAGPPLLDEPWTHGCPLVLIETDYLPHTPVPRPRGRIIWISPQSEPEFLRSLADVGLLDEVHVVDVA